MQPTTTRILVRQAGCLFPCVLYPRPKKSRTLTLCAPFAPCLDGLYCTSQGGRETFTFFVTDTGSSKAYLGIQLLYRPTRPPLTTRSKPPQTLQREASSASLPAGSRPGDVVIGEGFVDLLGLFPVVHGTYTPGALKGNSRRVAVPMREPEGKR